MELEFIVLICGTDSEKDITASSILNTGLILPQRAQSILSTAVSLGENHNPSELTQEVLSFKLGHGKTVSVILAVPEVIQNSDGDKIFLGFPEKNKRTAAQQHDAHCILDRIVEVLHRVPPEFVLGYYSETSNGEKCFVPNEAHFSKISQEKIDELFSSLSTGINENTKIFNDSVRRGLMTNIEKSRQNLHSRGVPTPLLDNLIHLAKKYSKSPKHIRKILIDRDN